MEKVRVIYNESEVLQTRISDNSITIYPANVQALEGSPEQAQRALMTLGINCEMFNEFTGLSCEIPDNDIIIDLPNHPDDDSISRFAHIIGEYDYLELNEIHLKVKIKHFPASEYYPDETANQTISNKKRVVIDAENNTIGEYNYFVMACSFGIDRYTIFREVIEERISKGSSNI